MAAPTVEPIESVRSATLPVAVAVVSGALVAVQQRINGGLKEALGDAVLAAVVSFGIGLVLCVAVVFGRANSRLALRGLPALPRWTLLGGFGGASLVAVGAAAAPEIGVALLTVAIVGGQTVGGVLVDGFGLGPGGRHRLTIFRAGGAALCLLAVGVSALGKATHARPVLLFLVLAAGVLVALQVALNGRVREATGDAAVATLVNFCVGLLALLIGLLARALLVGVHVDAWPGQWWLYTGGLIGAVFIAAAAVIVRQLGVLRFGLCVTAGQLLGAVLLDAVVPERGHTVAVPTVLAALLTFVAVGVSGRGRPS